MFCDSAVLRSSDWHSLRLGLIYIYTHGDSASIESFCEVNSVAKSWSVDCHDDLIVDDLISRLLASQSVADPSSKCLIHFKF